MEQFEILSVNVSEKKGTVKVPVDYIEINDKGVKNDAHAGNWHRQVSLLGAESIAKFESQGTRKIKFGDFAENITTQGIVLYETVPLDRFIIDDVLLEVTQIGKKCHNGCEIAKEVGNCVMPKEGIFARVLSGGIIRVGSAAEYQPKVFKIMTITLSDRASAGEYKDTGGSYLQDRIADFMTSGKRHYLLNYKLIPDSPEQLRNLISEAATEGYDMVFTTGGTGIGPRDFTPDVVRPMLEKEITGIMELIRVKYGTDKPAALISRSVAGTIGKMLVYTLPGSPKAIKEYTEEIFKTVHHSLFMLHGLDLHG